MNTFSSAASGSSGPTTFSYPKAADVIASSWPFYNTTDDYDVYQAFVNAMREAEILCALLDVARKLPNRIIRLRRSFNLEERNAALVASGIKNLLPLPRGNLIMRFRPP